MRLIAVASLLLLVAACGKELPDQRFFELPTPDLLPQEGAKGHRVLEVRPLMGEGLVGTVRNIVVRPAPGSPEISTSETAQWQEWPATAVARGLQRCLADTGQFRDVVTPEARVLPDYALGGTLTTMELVRGARPEVIMAADLSLVDMRQVRKVIWARTFRATVPVAGDDMTDAVVAFGQALEGICAEVAAATAADLR